MQAWKLDLDGENDILLNRPKTEWSRTKNNHESLWNPFISHHGYEFQLLLFVLIKRQEASDLIDI